MSKTAINDSVTILKPSEVFDAIRLATSTQRAMFIWGPPGISKSAVGQQAATAAGVAFVDVRLSQMDPTDLRGMPFRVEEDGRSTGVAWSAPLVLPRDLDIHQVRSIDATETIVSFKSNNPKGVNGIHYVKKPVITVESLTEGADAVLVSQTPQTFVVKLVGEGGKPVAGKIVYHVEGKAEALLAFEELNSAPPSVLASAYQIILDRRQGEYEVPEGVKLVAMGNRANDKGVTFVLPKPLANRFLHVEMKSDFEDWSAWAVDAMIDPLILGYLEENKGELFNFDAQSNSHAFATPRSWHFVSDLMKSDVSVSPRVMTAAICGAVGDGIGTKFNTFRKFAGALPKVDDIMSGRVTEMDEKLRKNVSAAFTLVISLCYELRLQHDALDSEGHNAKSTNAKRNAWYERFERTLQFWLNNFQPEINVMGMRLLIKTHEIPMSDRQRVPSITEFTKRYASLLRK